MKTELDANTVLDMTGWALIETLGDTNGYIQVQKEYSFTAVSPTKSTEWCVWATVGRGKQANKVYVHMTTVVQAKIVDRKGQDTRSRMPLTIHVRGLAKDKTRTYEEIK